MQGVGSESGFVACAALAVLLLAAPTLAGGQRQFPLLGDPARGKVVIIRAACASCHDIPGIADRHGMVGPPLTHFGRRKIIAGMLPNARDNLAHWLRFPQAVVRGNAMPNMGLTEAQARDAAAYLESLR